MYVRQRTQNANSQGCNGAAGALLIAATSHKGNLVLLPLAVSHRSVNIYKQVQTRRQKLCHVLRIHANSMINDPATTASASAVASVG